jgi:uncharacterized 2Fe-2S/4Fe-4S cluster protein (DUF4445 family)
MDELIKIEITYDDKPSAPIWSYPGQNLWEALVAHGLITAGPCGGKRICGKCKLKIEGPLNPPDEAERYLLLPEEIKAGMRLACRIPATQGLKVFLEGQPFTAAPVPRLMSETAAPPMVMHKKIYLPGQDRHNPVSIQERLQKSLPNLHLNLSIADLNELHSLDRTDRPVLELNALLTEDRQLIYAGRSRQDLYGVALDVGTTSLVGSLLDLETGQTVATTTMPNMQRVYGDNIISRLDYCLSHDDGLQTLHQVIVNNANTLIASLVRQCKSLPDQVYRLVVVGNPVMTHFVLGLNPAGLAAAPFSGIITDAYSCRAGAVGLAAHREALLVIPPQARGFIGSDALAGLLTLPCPPPLPYLFIDIGTNSEVILAGQKGMWAASAAAGPAFEGAGIRCGMRAVHGAIDHFQWNDGRLDYHVLGNGEPRGMCGSALVDLLAWLLNNDMVAANGSFMEGRPEIRAGSQGRELVIVPSEKSYQGVPLVLSQEDVRSLQLAKGAVRAAIEILMRESGTKVEALKAVFLAGAFGNYLNPEHAIKAGILPAVNPDLIHNLGNAAGRGAICYLINPQARQQMGQMKQNLTCVELADHPDFQLLFLRHIDF